MIRGFPQNWCFSESSQLLYLIYTSKAPTSFEDVIPKGSSMCRNVSLCVELRGVNTDTNTPALAGSQLFGYVVSFLMEWSQPGFHAADRQTDKQPHRRVSL